MAVRLVALDIDGTLLPSAGPHRGRLSPRLRAAVSALAASGCAVVLASGRMLPGTVRVARELGLRAPLIAQDGCVTADAGGRIARERRLDPALALDVVGWARARGYACEWFGTHRYAASEESEATRVYGEMCGVSPEYHPAPETLGIVPNGVGVLSDGERSPAVHRALAERHGDALTLLDFPHVTVAVAPDASKGRALALVARDLGVPRARTLAIGDSVNDVSMLAWAGRGLAVAAADRHAREAADETLPDEVDAVARALEGLLPR